MSSPRQAPARRPLAATNVEPRGAGGAGAAAIGAPARAPEAGAGALQLPQNLEQELKLRLRPADVAALRARLDRLASARTGLVDSTYFDTPDLRLARARAALRLRALGQGKHRHWVQTFKTEDSGAAFSRRGEWEMAVPQPRIHPERFAGSPLAATLQAGGPAQGSAADGAMSALEPVFRTRFTRSTWDLALPAAQVEVVIDEGFIEAGGRRESILEAELEVQSGSASAVWELALALAGDGARRGANLALLPYGDSKAARGYRLAARQPAAPHVGGSMAPLDPGMDIHRAARQLMCREMNCLLANIDGVAQAADPEFVHQARVALRRLRSGLDALGADVPAPLAQDLRQWAERLGEVRDWDLMCAQWLPALAGDADAGLAAHWPRLQRAADRRRDAARARLQKRVSTPEFAVFALRALQWSASRPPPAALRVADVAPDVVAGRLQRLLKSGASFARQSPQRQHRQRLRAKALRYTIELLGAALPARARRTPLRALGRFQETAGRAQDTVALAALLARLTRSAALRNAAAAWAKARRRKAVAAAQRALDKLGNQYRRKLGAELAASGTAAQGRFNAPS